MRHYESRSTVDDLYHCINQGPWLLGIRVSQDALLREFLLAPARPIEKITADNDKEAEQRKKLHVGITGCQLNMAVLTIIIAGAECPIYVMPMKQL